MDYALAKQLEAAGFQSDSTRYEARGSICDRPEADHKKCNDWDCHVEQIEIPDPTLEELIEACVALMKPIEPFPLAYDFFELAPNINTTQSGGGKELGDIEEWRASRIHGPSLDDMDHQSNYFGKTPIGAVARLWLALNKK